jgi:hypothetical protein
MSKCPLSLFFLSNRSLNSRIVQTFWYPYYLGFFWHCIQLTLAQGHLFWNYHEVIWNGILRWTKELRCNFPLTFALCIQASFSLIIIAEISQLHMVKFLGTSDIMLKAINSISLLNLWDVNQSDVFLFLYHSK